MLADVASEMPDLPEELEMPDVHDPGTLSWPDIDLDFSRFLFSEDGANKT